MTREEAIKYFRNAKGLSSTFDKAADMAIEALSAEYEDYEHATLVDIKEPLKVAVVRCKDCRHWHSNTEFCGIWSFQNIAQRTLSDDYCSRAERREK